MMADYDEDEPFFEEDEPAAKIHNAFDRGARGTTEPPSIFLSLAMPSLNSALTCPPTIGSPFGGLVTDAQAAANTARPPLVHSHG